MGDPPDAPPWRILRRALGEPFDPGNPHTVDPELLELLAPWVDRACRAWFRLEVRDQHLVPDGPALLVGNHNSGMTFLEAMGTGARWIRERGPDDAWAGLAHDGIIDMPVLGRLLARIGAVRAGHAPAAEAFEAGRKVIVFPGGNREAFRRSADRDRIQFAGRTGWVKLAVRHQVPIVPVVFFGGHHGFYVVREGKRFARWSGAQRVFRTDTWPLIIGLPWGVAFGPTFHLPLPVKCVTRYLDPVDPGLAPDAVDDPAALQRVYDDVVHRMQAALYELADERRGVIPRER